MPRDSLPFRRDINGLRAWAVIAVVLYHFRIPHLTGGFIGVDVFFVISGFLMTGIVVSSLERGGFSISDFYAARARRILPALASLCLVLLILGWYFLLQEDYKTLAGQVIAALLFFSNILFWREAGYFDPASHEKWLLHTWSLSVEWQFYLMLPIMILALWRFLPGRRHVILFFLLGFIISLAASVVVTTHQPSFAFYLLPARAWELLAGGIIKLIENRFQFSNTHRHAFEETGLILITGSMIILNESTAWPGWHALLPVIGSIMVLMAAHQNSVWTGHGLAQWMGNRSYSVYLWHWPIVVLLNYVNLSNEPLAIAAGVFAVLLLGQLSYTFVEVPTRKGLEAIGVSKGAVTLLLSSLLIVLPALLIRLSNGVSGRLALQAEEIRNEALNRAPRRDECHPKSGVKSPSCIFGGDQLRLIVIGDSHADALISAVAAAAPHSNDGVMQWSYSACPTMRGVRATRPGARQCSAFVDWALNELSTIPADVPVLIINRHGAYALGPNEDPERSGHPEVFFSKQYNAPEDLFLYEYKQHLEQTACEIAKSRTVYLLRPIPEMVLNVPKYMSRSIAWGQGQRVVMPLEDYRQRNAPFWRAQDAANERCGVRILDPLPYLCPNGKCYGDKDGRPLYYDDNHLSEYGNKLLVPMFSKIFSRRAGEE